MQKLKILLQYDIIYIFILIISLLISYIYTINYKSKININDKTFTGTITKIKIKDNKINIIIKLKNKESLQIYYNNSNDEIFNEIKEKITLGSIVEVNGELEVPENNTIPNTYNYKKYLKNNNIHYILKSNEISIIKKESILYKIKNIISKRIDKLKSKNYIYAFILGDTTNLPSDVMNSYKTNGINHLFAISGTHITFILLFFDKIFRKENKIKLIFLFSFLLFYGFIINYSASFLRASTYICFKKIYEYNHIKYKNRNILFLTIGILLLINPFLLFNVGFQYSSIITLGIVLFSNNNIETSKIKNLFKLSFIAFIFSLPLNLFYNYKINIISILNNLIFVPIIITFVFPLSFLAFIFPFIDSLLLLITEKIEIISLFFNNKISLIINLSINIYILILLYILIFITIYKNRMIIVAIVMLLITVKIEPYFNNELKIYYLDVSQGDCTLIIFPKREKIIMIDTGGLIEYNKTTTTDKISKIIEFLNSININKIDHLILTHGDYDHMGWSINLVNNFKVENVIFNSDSYNELEIKLIKVLESKNIKYYKGLKELNIGNDKLYFLNSKEYTNENDNSNIVYFKINNYKFLFMGDAGIEREKDILEKYNLTDIDFIKIGHHGSNTSSDKYFIDSIKPKNCLISVGAKNRYGHPKDSVIETLNNYCNIYRTDLNGSIEVKIDKNNYKIKTYSP